MKHDALIVRAGTLLLALVVFVASPGVMLAAGAGVDPGASENGGPTANDAIRDGTNGTDCRPSPETLAAADAVEGADRVTVGGTLLASSSNNTTVYPRNETARVETVVDSGRGLGAVGELGTVGFSYSWTAPCDGNYTVSVAYNVTGTVEQHREANPFGNGVTRARVQSRFEAGNVTETATWATVARTNRTERDSMIPHLEDLADDAVVNTFSAAVEQLLGVPFGGETVAKEVGIVRNDTDLSEEINATDRRLSLTVDASEGDEFNFNYQVGAAIIATSIGNGGSSGNVTAGVDVRNVTVSRTDARNGSTAPAGSPERTLPSGVEPGGNATITVETNASSPPSFAESFDPAVEDATVDRVTVDGRAVSPFSTEADGNGVVVTLSQLATAPATVTVEYTLSIPANATVGTAYAIDGTLNTRAGEQHIPTDRLTVRERGPVGVVDRYDTDKNDRIDITELGAAAANYARGDLSIADLGDVAVAYARS